MAHRLRRRAMALLCRTRLYRYTLAGRTPREFVKNLAIRWPGDGKRGAALLAGNIQLAGETVRLAAPYAAPEEAGTDWLAEFHRFTRSPPSARAAAGQRARALAARRRPALTRPPPVPRA